MPLTTSADYKTAIASTNREMRGYIKFNNDGTKLMRGCDGLISITHTAQLCQEERPMFGSCNAAVCEVEFFNSGIPAGVSLANSYFDAYIGVWLEDTGTAPVGSIEPDTAKVEYVFLGRFDIDVIERGKMTTKVTAYDEFAKLNKEYVPTVVKGGSGYSISDILQDIRSQCGFRYNTASASVTGYVQELYKCTCREMLGWIMNANTYNSNYYLGGNLLMSRLNVNMIATSRLNYQYTLKDNYTITDATIYMGGLDDGEDFTVSSVVTGTEDNPISHGSGTGIVGENPYLTQTLCDDLYTRVNGIVFKPMEIEFRGDPSLLIGDVVKVTSNGESNYCYIQKIVTTFNGGCKQTITCYGNSEWHYEMSTSPTETKIQTVSNMAQEIQQEIETARNGVVTQILDADGSWKELVIANNQDLDSATSVWRWNINGLAHSNAYNGGTYNFAVDMNGRIIADVIQTGILKDAANKNSWNLDTGALTITNGSINITTSSLSYDVIQLTYGTNTTRISPNGLQVDETSGGLNTSITPGYITGKSSASVACFSLSHHSSLDGLLYLRNRNNQVVVEMDARGNNNDGTGYFVIRNTSGYVAAQTIVNQSGHGQILTYDSSGNEVFSLYPNTPALYIGTHSSYKSVIVGATSSNNPSGQLSLYSGTDNLPRTSLTNNYLKFYDSNGYSIYTYPSYGLYLQDFESRNLCRNQLQSKTLNGVTATVNTDGSVTVSGTASAATTFFIVGTGWTPVTPYPLTNGASYILSGCPSGGSGTTYKLWLYEYSGSSVLTQNIVDTGSGYTFTRNSSADGYLIGITVHSGTAMGTPGKTFKPMVRKAAVTDSTFVPWVAKLTDREAAYPISGLPKLTGAVDSTAATGCVFAVPPQTFSSATTRLAAAEALLKYICANYPNKTACTFIGNYITTANRRGYELYISSTSSVDANGVPQYASGFVYEASTTMVCYAVNCNNYVTEISFAVPQIGETETTDLDNCTEMGFYGYTSAAANNPTGTGGVLFSANFNSVYKGQLLFGNSGSNPGSCLYYRRKNSNGWQTLRGILSVKTQTGRVPFNESVIDYAASSGTTATYTLTSTHTYLVTVARRNSTAVDKDGIWICSCHSTSSHLTALKTPTGTYTISVSSTTLSITTWDNYMNISILDLGAA